MVPVEVWPSPHVIVAVKSLTVALGLASVNVATVAVIALPSTALMLVPVPANSASATVAVLVVLAVLPSTSVIATLIGSSPVYHSAELPAPDQTPFLSLLVPVEVWPSPQVILAV